MRAPRARPRDLRPTPATPHQFREEALEELAESIPTRRRAGAGARYAKRGAHYELVSGERPRARRVMAICPPCRHLSRRVRRGHAEAGLIENSNRGPDRLTRPGVSAPDRRGRAGRRKNWRADRKNRSVTNTLRLLNLRKELQAPGDERITMAMPAHPRRPQRPRQSLVPQGDRSRGFGGAPDESHDAQADGCGPQGRTAAPKTRTSPGSRDALRRVSAPRNVRREPRRALRDRVLQPR